MEHASSRSTLPQAVLVTHMRAKPVYLNDGAASNRCTKIVPHSNTGCLLTPSYCLAAGLRQNGVPLATNKRGHVIPLVSTRANGHLSLVPT
jgi:hypothetical protein